MAADCQESWRTALNAIVHPRIQAEFERKKEELVRRGVNVAIYDAALLIENGLHEKLDGVILVAIPEEMQISRLMARDGVTREAALARLAAQLPLAEKRRNARWIIDNSGDLESTRGQVQRIWKEINDEH